MKLTKIALAVLATVAGSSAFALTANNYTNGGEFSGNTLNIRISGASAQDTGILGSALSLCTVGSVHRYEISNNFVYFCTPDVGSGAGQITVPAGITQLAIYKYSAGGSYYGVGPVNSNTAATGATLTSTGNQLPFLDLTKLTAANCGTSTVSTPTFNTGTNARSYTNIKCGGASSGLTTLATTYIGLSDVEPAFFSTATGNLTSEAVYALIFGVPVTKNIRDALQTQQTLVSGSELAANQPSLTSAQIVSAYTQPGQVWAGIGVNAPSLTSDAIYIARRVDSSGTQKSFEALFARTPNGQGGLKNCAVGTTAFAVPDSGTVGTNTGDADSLCASATPPTVYSGSGGGNVRTCLTNHNTAGRGAIGILTTEDKYDATNALGDYRFVKVDGIAPTQANAASGAYRGYVESFLNVRTSGAFATGSALGYSAFVTRLKTDLANPAIIKLINGSDQAFGAAGLMALLSKQAAGTVPDFTGAQSVIPWTKTAGTAVDNCQAPQLFN